MRAAFVSIVLIFAGVAAAQEQLPHTVWLEAESFGPLHGANFSFQQTDRTTKGSWALSGPGCAAEWTQGGESGFLSVAARADEPGEIAIGRDTEIPAAGNYSLWVRYVDYRGKKESFGVRIKQGDKTFTHIFGERSVVDELDQMKLLWDSAFGWDHAAVELKKGPAHIELYTTGPTEARRQVDCLCLTTDAGYHPGGREKPDCAAWRVLRGMRESGLKPVESLRATPSDSGKDRWALPAGWKSPSHPPAFLWNTGQAWVDTLKKKDERVEWPFNIDTSLEKQFIADFHGKDVPVFGDVLSGPTIHVPIYPATLGGDSPLPGWLDQHSDRPFAILLNYGAPNWPKKDADKAVPYQNLKKLGDRFIGFVSGESLSYGPVDGSAMNEKIRAAKSRGEVLAAVREANSAGVMKGMSNIYGKDLTAEQAWEKLIPCMSASNEAYVHAVANWGSKRVGHESTGNSPTLARRLAFLRGSARQFNSGICDYQSCNLGDASTIYSRESQMYPGNARYIFDNSYDAWAGCGMNWVLKDYLLFHVAGADAFYHEEGQDIFWKPGGNSAGDGFPIGLSPRGRVTEAVINIARHPRGSQYTPVAFLLDEAHGWSQEQFQPGAFGLDPTLNPAVLSHGKHEASIRGWFDVAYYPAPETQNEPASAIRQGFVNGIFGDIFDVIVTAPKHTEIVRTYPVLIVSGSATVSQEWGDALKNYVESGGTLVVCDGQLTGPGVSSLQLPALGPESVEASSLAWTPTSQSVGSNVFRFHPITSSDGHILAKAEEKTLAVALDRGRGRLIFIAVPMGLGIDERPVPVLPLVLRHLTPGLLPFRVSGDVEWAVNRLDDGGWLITILNNRGVIKPQHGMLPTDYHEAQTVHIDAMFKVSKSDEWVAREKVDWIKGSEGGAMSITIPAGAVRMIEVHPG